MSWIRNAIAARVSLSALIAVCAAHACGHAVGCSSAARMVDEANDPSDDEKLAKCRAEGRASMQIYGDADRAIADYDACKRDAGL